MSLKTPRFEVFSWRVVRRHNTANDGWESGRHCAKLELISSAFGRLICTDMIYWGHFVTLYRQTSDADRSDWSAVSDVRETDIAKSRHGTGNYVCMYYYFIHAYRYMTISGILNLPISCKANKKNQITNKTIYVKIKLHRINVRQEDMLVLRLLMNVLILYTIPIIWSSNLPHSSL